MPVLKKNLLKSPEIGLYIVATDKFCLVPPFAREKDKEYFEEVLNVPVIETRIAGSSLLGVFIAANSNGIVVPWFTQEDEIRKLKDEGIDVLVVKDRVTALGNLISVNDRGIIVSEEVSERAFNEIREFLGVEGIRKSVAGIEVVGASVVATNRGFLAHPSMEEEKDLLKEVFKVDGVFTTVNFGDPFVRTGVVANSYGIIVGEDTSPVELLRIEDVFG